MISDKYEKNQFSISNKQIYKIQNQLNMVSFKEINKIASNFQSCKNLTSQLTLTEAI